MNSNWNIFQGKLRINRLFIFSITFLITLLVLIPLSRTQEPIKITVMMQALEATQWEPLEARFEKANPDIDLEIIKAPNATNLVEDLYTSAFILGDTPYDLAYLDMVWLPKFAAAGWLRDLYEFITPEELEGFLPGDVEGGIFQGGLYRMPFRSDGGMLYYRSDMLAENGYEPPDTFEELVTIAEDLQAKGVAKWGFVWQGKQYEGLPAMFIEILEGFGAYWINADTLEVGLDEENAIAAVEFLRNTVLKGISPPGVTTYAEEESRRLFEAGETVFLRNWPYVAVMAADSDIAGKYGLKPMVHREGYASAACQGGWGLGITSNSPHPEEAWRVVEFVASEENQRQFVLETGYIPSLRSLYNDPAIVAKYPHYPQLLEVVENATLRPPIVQYAQASDILQRYLSAALTDTMTSEQAMRAAAAETRSLLVKFD